MISDTISILTDSTLIETVHSIANDTLVIKIQHCTTSSGGQSTILEYVLKNGITIVIALIAGLIAIYQVKSNVISNARIKWMDDLRANLSSYYSLVLETISHYINMNLVEGEIDGLDYDKYILCHSRLNMLANKIKMQLDSERTYQMQIEALIDEIDSMMNGKVMNNTKQEELEAKLKSIVVISKKIFKEEWKRSKKVFKL